MKDEAAKHGYDVVVVSGELYVARQQNQVKGFIVRKVAAIVLTPCDSKAIGSSIMEANAAGFRCLLRISSSFPRVKVVCHVATDNYSGGKQAAAALIDAIGDKGQRFLILDHPVVESVMLRTKGFERSDRGRRK